MGVRDRPTMRGWGRMALLAASATAGGLAASLPPVLVTLTNGGPHPLQLLDGDGFPSSVTAGGDNCVPQQPSAAGTATVAAAGGAVAWLCPAAPAAEAG